MEFGQLKKYNVRNFFFGKNLAENEADKLVPDPLLFFEKALFKVKASGRHFSCNIFWYTLNWTYNENKLFNIYSIF